MAVIDEVRNLLQGRLNTLDGERKRLERALSALSENGPAPRRGPGRPRAAGKAVPRGRRKRNGGRAVEAIALIEQKPGITASDMAKKMKIKPNYLYRVLGDLEKEGKVVKSGRTYSPVS